MADPKHAALLLALGGGKSKGDEPMDDATDDGGDEMKHDEAPFDDSMKEFADAAKSGDIEGMKSAFRAAFMFCEMEPHEEAEPEEMPGQE